ncbi:bifunctional 5,10-methylenetetrahydrofolate dehydrogenase/5,10-methenyltetrahydrofolate cyclohydrolase [Levilactobacillus bambusae]|uniref:Bifunctional protein FolD n=1 Tax=Levilactobacillus bambusae TaxID=2024736 RepID=A0A2V1N0W6_9LACO|nr:bifunctional 5,10-methylenetetrahydrofolate dehydrogenase/5,10-methenyltetrahydrofolate cyclohydrolase [Levilactobacillus bambusae]PWG00931.1 bifunctional methylenetetrahydrofolate dehydrogenase/methenyltetrahydrofolate cyclohydrolase [Levilactobacillus bambusae]
MAIKIDGTALANQVNETTLNRVVEMSKRGRVPGLAVVLVGNDHASQIYVQNKERTAKKLGIHSEVIRLPESTTQRELLDQVNELNMAPAIDGILVQFPLPAHLDEVEVTRTILPEKDVDGFHPDNLGRLFEGDHGSFPVACTPQGIMTMLESVKTPLKGQNAVVVGRSKIVGRPMSALLLRADATVTIAHRYTPADVLPVYTRNADILIVATGIYHLITADMVKPGATVIDVGMDRDPDGKLAGDVDYFEVEKKVRAISPVPGGVGPMTIATLMKQTVDLAEWHEER